MLSGIVPRLMAQSTEFPPSRPNHVSYEHGYRTTISETCYPLASKVEVRREATIIETEIFNTATSLDEYHHRCAQKALELLEKAKETTALNAEEDAEPEPEPTGPRVDIGEYKNAVYYREGLFSVVYKAVAPTDKEYFTPQVPPETGDVHVVALKLTNPSTMQPPHDSFREARILKLAQSDRVIPLLETFREDSHFVIVFPFMPFEFGRLLQQDRLSREQIRRCLQDLFTALKFVHSQDIIHRDVKPSNILLKSLDGPAYLSDFGISWSPAAPGSETAGALITDVGTTCYRAPELLFGNRSYGSALDMWAAGCVFAEAVVPGHPTLFDSGELGSDLALIHSIFTKLGTPRADDWPSAARYPDWGKMMFKEYPRQSCEEWLPSTREVEREVVLRLVRFEPESRMPASEVLEQEYFTEPLE